MKKYFAVLLAALLLSGIMTLPAAARPTVTAHAGALDTEENSLDNFQKVLTYLGIDVLECDLRFQDGVPVLSHLPSISGDPVTLGELFALAAATDCGVNLDLREIWGGDLAQASLLAEEYGIEDRVFFTGVHIVFLLAASKLKLPYYYNAYPLLSFSSLANRLTCAFAKRIGAVGLNLPYYFCSENLVKTAHEMGLLVSVWTVDDEGAMHEMIAMGVDNITTRSPDLLLALLEGN